MKTNRRLEYMLVIGGLLTGIFGCGVAVKCSAEKESFLYENPQVAKIMMSQKREMTTDPGIISQINRCDKYDDEASYGLALLISGIGVSGFGTYLVNKYHRN